jgi:hypothetical protein
MRDRLILALFQNLVLAGVIVGGFELPYILGYGR